MQPIEHREEMHKGEYTLIEVEENELARMKEQYERRFEPGPKHPTGGTKPKHRKSNARSAQKKARKKNRG